MKVEAKIYRDKTATITLINNVCKRHQSSQVYSRNSSKLDTLVENLGFRNFMAENRIYERGFGDDEEDLSLLKFFHPSCFETNSQYAPKKKPHKPTTVEGAYF